MPKKHIQAPLPFQGQKRNFLTQFTELINQLPDDSTIVDLFGGSGLLSHTAKQLKPKAKIVYNDFDNYTERLNHIDQTNELISKLQVSFSKHLLLVQDKIPNDLKTELIQIIEEHQQKHGYLDYLTLSSNLLFSGKYADNLEALKKEWFYNKITQKTYCKDGYLDGVIVENSDYRSVFEKYKSPSFGGVGEALFFIVDPPYLSTDISTYKNDKYWKITDYLNVLSVLENKKYVYFSSDKSEIIELCNWLGKHDTTWKNPFAGTTTITRQSHLNKDAKYTDIMVYKI